MLKSNLDLQKELNDPQAFADKLGLQTHKYLKFFPGYVPDGMELKFIAARVEGFDLICAPITVELDPMEVSPRDIFERGGVILHYRISDNNDAIISTEEARKSFDAFAESGKSINVQRSVEIVGSNDVIVLMQDGRFGGLVKLHGKISIHAITALFGADEVYKMLEKPIEEDWF